MICRKAFRKCCNQPHMISGANYLSILLSFWCLLGDFWAFMNLSPFLMWNFRYFYGFSGIFDDSRAFSKIPVHFRNIPNNPGIRRIFPEFPAAIPTPKIIKVDTITKKMLFWNEQNVYPSEPIFVPSPSPKVSVHFYNEYPNTSIALFPHAKRKSASFHSFHFYPFAFTALERR